MDIKRLLQIKIPIIYNLWWVITNISCVHYGCKIPNYSMIYITPYTQVQEGITQDTYITGFIITTNKMHWKSQQVRNILLSFLPFSYQHFQVENVSMGALFSPQIKYTLGVWRLSIFWGCIWWFYFLSWHYLRW